MKNDDAAVRVFISLAIVVAIIILGPIIFMWSLNTLFGLKINITGIPEYFAALVLLSIIWWAGNGVK